MKRTLSLFALLLATVTGTANAQSLGQNDAFPATVDIRYHLPVKMRDGIESYGPVRAGVYAMTGYEGVDAHAESLGQTSRATDGWGNPGEDVVATGGAHNTAEGD